MASISKRNGSYRVHWRETNPATGRQVQRQRTTRTRREAEQLRAEVKHHQDAGIYVSPSTRTIGVLLDEWTGVLELAVANGRLAETTLRTYRNQLDNHVRRRWEHLPLQQLTAQHLRDMFRELADAGMSASARKHLHVLVKRMLRHALNEQYVHRNVADAVDAPRVRVASGRDQALSPAELEKLLAAVAEHSPRFQHAVTLAAHTGMRRGELCGLMWDDVDLEAATVRVRRSRPRTNVEKAPKTTKGARTVHLLPSTIDVLRAVRRTQAEHQLRAGAAYQRTGYVLTNELGKPIDPDKLTKEFARTRAAAGLPDSIVLHSLRHTFVTLMLDSGANAKVVSDLVGHTDVAFTMRTYQHPSEDAAREAMRTFGRALTGLG